MTPKYINDLRYYTMELNESPEMAESMAQSFIDKFNSLNKYEQLSMSLIIENDGFDEAFDMIDKI
jgi:hypothetical protein